MPDRTRKLVNLADVETGGADHHRHAGSEAQADIAEHGVGAREVDRGIGLGHIGVDHLVAGSLESRSEHRADLPPRTEERDPHAARATIVGIELLHGFPHACLVGSDRSDRNACGKQDRARQGSDGVRGHV